MVEEYKSLQSIRKRVHEEIEEASREIRVDIDKLQRCIRAFTEIMGSVVTRESISMAKDLADSMSQMSRLEESGSLGRIAAALVGVR